MMTDKDDKIEKMYSAFSLRRRESSASTWFLSMIVQRETT